MGKCDWFSKSFLYLKFNGKIDRTFCFITWSDSVDPDLH
ncbi:hypothetical protein AC062_1125 [Pasteurellaceae bacterium NI1060]|nr:hypothetical protein AC062_1125 [Pasteurellaceae bacterium NI1060]